MRARHPDFSPARAFLFPFDLQEGPIRAPFERAEIPPLDSEFLSKAKDSFALWDQFSPGDRLGAFIGILHSGNALRSFRALRALAQHENFSFLNLRPNQTRPLARALVCFLREAENTLRDWDAWEKHHQRSQEPFEDVDGGTPYAMATPEQREATSFFIELLIRLPMPMDAPLGENPRGGDTILSFAPPGSNFGAALRQFCAEELKRTKDNLHLTPLGNPLRFPWLAEERTLGCAMDAKSANRKRLRV